MEEVDDFFKRPKPYNKKRKGYHCYGLLDSFKDASKNGYLKGLGLERYQYDKIIDTINLMIVDELLKGEKFRFPHNMGTIEIARKEAKVIFGYKSQTYHKNYGIDWKSTMKMWKDNPGTKEQRKVVWFDMDYVYRIYYNFNSAIFRNKLFYRFRTSYTLKKQLMQYLNENKEINTIYGK